MTKKISTWGNSYGIRLPKVLMKECKLKEGSELELNVTADGKIVLEPAERLPSLKALLKIGKQNTFHEEFWTDKPQGEEIW